MSEKFCNIENVLRSGRVINGFSSGGGVRVLRIDRPKKNEYYAEGATIYEAFFELEEIIKNKNHKAKMYFTGAYPDKDKPFDIWCRIHDSFSLKYKEKYKFFGIDIKWLDFENTPSHITETVFRTGKDLIYKNETGKIWHVGMSIFPNGEPAAFSKRLDKKQSKTPTKTSSFYCEDLEILLDSLESCLPKIGK
jgi:hypothetical protein